jgi:hypothetical protein
MPTQSAHERLSRSLPPTLWATAPYLVNADTVKYHLTVDRK